MTLSAGAGRRPPTGPGGALARASGVELLGAARGSGYLQPPALVRRGDGQVLQLTPLLHGVLEAIDGERDADAVAEAAGERTGRAITAADVQQLVDGQLRPLGLLRLADGSDPEVRRADPLLRMRFRTEVTDPARTQRITRPFQALISPIVVVPVLVAFAVVTVWVLATKGLASATHQAFEQPWLLLLVFAVTVLSAGFHEFGHAAAASRAGAVPGRMGMGLYLVWPAFFTDVTDSYRLDRRGRLLTDVGGLYFNAIVAVAIAIAWWLTRADALLLVVAGQLLLMVRQLIPIIRFDGYHLLADAVGVPDLFQRIRPTLVGMLPWRWGREEQVLRPGARAVITAWVLVTVPLLLLAIALLVLTLPRLLGSAWHGVQEQAVLAGAGTAAGDPVAAAGHAIGIVAIAIPIAGILYLVVRLARQLVVGAWRAGDGGRPVRRAVALAAVGAMFACAGWAWWPGADTYRPVQAYEGGTLGTAIAAVVPGPDGVRERASGEAVSLWQGGAELPTAEAPALATVLVPSERSADERSADEAAADAPSWVFPFEPPEAPGEGDAQALAVATGDGAVAYDVVFALVWADGDEAVDTTNEAYALASCDGCAAVAVSFQVVLVLGQADVVVPQNLSAAVTYDCVSCLAYALASQLVVTLDGPLSDASLAELEAIWAEVAAYGATIRDRPLDEIERALSAFRDRIRAVVTAEGGSTGSEVEDAAPSPSPAEPGPTAGPADQTPAPSREATPAPAPSTAPSPAPSGPAPAGPAPTAPAPAESAPTERAPAPTEPVPTPEPTSG